MTITLPSTMAPNSADPMLVDFGAVLKPFSGGPPQRINRLGLRLAARFTISPKRYRTDGRILISRLMQAKTDRLLINWRQPGFDPGNEGVPRVKVAVSGGTTLQIKGLPAGYQAREGQYFSLVKGLRFLHIFAGDGAADEAGDMVASVWPPMRVALSVNDVIEIAQPKMEGYVNPDEELSWHISVDKFVDVAFTLAETK